MKKWMFFIGLLFTVILSACTNETSSQDNKKPDDKAGGNKVMAKVENIEGKKVNKFTLTAQESKWELSSKKTITAWTYNGTVPGEQIRVKEGEAVSVTLKNKLKEPVSIHWHGIPLSNKMDGIPGVTQDAVPPGKEFKYEFVADTPGTYWYHSHQDGVNQLDKGLYGTIIVESKDDAKYNRDYTLVLDEWQSNPTEMNMGGSSDKNQDKESTSKGKNNDGMEGMDMSGNGNMKGMDTNKEDKKGTGDQKDSSNNKDSNSMPGMSGMDDMSSYDIYTINGKTYEKSKPLKVKKGDLVKLRFVNAGYKAHQIHIPVKYKITNVDGQPVNQPSEQGDRKILEVAPGERYDVEFTATGEDFTIDCHGNMEAAKGMQIDVDDETGNKTIIDSAKTTGNINIANLGKSTSSQFSLDDKFDVEYNMDLGTQMSSNEMQYTINGKAYPNVPPLKVEKGDKVKVTLKNVSEDKVNHPMHLHGHFFQVLSKNGKPFTGAPIVKDTLNVKPGETYEVAFLADNPGNWLFHCHDLHHASSGMVQVVKYKNFQEFYKDNGKVDNQPE